MIGYFGNEGCRVQNHRADTLVEILIVRYRKYFQRRKIIEIQAGPYINFLHRNLERSRGVRGTDFRSTFRTLCFCVFVSEKRARKTQHNRPGGATGGIASCYDREFFSRISLPNKSSGADVGRRVATGCGGNRKVRRGEPSQLVSSGS